MGSCSSSLNKVLKCGGGNPGQGHGQGRRGSKDSHPGQGHGRRGSNDSHPGKGHGRKGSK
ncbi:hypothetical protein DPMN_017524 [Dreissena polymorpha]|uniref:Uncharacterized protein n=1 Tax=Dreissena polymorpha TaxID=45954 RepID=A0A9D4NBJ3_DREPO|nr:hypothetical protein DPMN_017524 [Dreissena polymorpha]